MCIWSCVYGKIQQVGIFVWFLVAIITTLFSGRVFLLRCKSLVMLSFLHQTTKPKNRKWIKKALQL
jgi:hypothetical protein